MGFTLAIRSVSFKAANNYSFFLSLFNLYSNRKINQITCFCDLFIFSTIKPVFNSKTSKINVAIHYGFKKPFSNVTNF